MKTTSKKFLSTGLTRRFVAGALLLGMTFSQVGSGCECAGLAAAVGLATPIIMFGRELQEAKKTALETERLEAEKQAQCEAP